jgi:hypothetical protein
MRGGMGMRPQRHCVNCGDTPGGLVSVLTDVDLALLTEAGWYTDFLLGQWRHDVRRRRVRYRDLARRRVGRLVSVDQRGRTRCSSVFTIRAGSGW